MIKIPEYIRKHIEANNRLLEQADNHAMGVRKWYEKRLDKLDGRREHEEFSEIQTN